MNRIKDLFNVDKPIIAMIHLLPMPGSIKYSGDVNQIIDRAMEDAKILVEEGVHGLLIENAGDTPYSIDREVDPIQVVLMGIIGDKIKTKYNIPCGINVAINSNKNAIAIAKAANLDFIRATSWVNGYFSKQGFVKPNSHYVIKYMQSIDATDKLILADVQIKNGSHFFLSDKSIVELAKDIESSYADAVIITGISTGVEPKEEDLRKLSQAISIPLFLGSGATKKNIKKIKGYVNGVIIGTHFRENGQMINPINVEKVKEFMSEYKAG